MLKLTKTTDYAVRILVMLAKQSQPVTMHELSKTLCISYHHVAKLVQRLQRQGMIRSVRGKYGGILLDISAEALTLRQVVDVIEGPTRLSECLVDGSNCHLTPECKLRVVFHDLEKTINHKFEAVTLQSLL